jgi:hypothetical protein
MTFRNHKSIKIFSTRKQYFSFAHEEHLRCFRQRTLARLRCACQGMFATVTDKERLPRGRKAVCLCIARTIHSRCFGQGTSSTCQGALLDRSKNTRDCDRQRTSAQGRKDRSLYRSKNTRDASSQRSLLDYSTNVLFHKGFMEKFRKFSEILRFLIWVKEVNYHKIDLFITQIIGRGGVWE